MKFCSWENKGLIYGTKGSASTIAQPKQEEYAAFVFPNSYTQLPQSINVSSLQLRSPVEEMVDGGTTEAAVENKMQCVLCVVGSCSALRKQEAILLSL